MSYGAVAASLVGALLIVAASAPDARSLERAGNSAAVRGQVARANEEHPVGLQIASGEPIFLADQISSGPASGMQIMLLDQTTFTIGPDSFVKIDEFVYDPATSVGKVTATLGKGVFRFVTGKIAQTDPSSMTVKLPVATIGIRGTMVYGRTDENSAMVGLAGAGPDNNTHDRTAGIDVTTPEGTVKIRRPGWGAIVERGKAPVVQRLPPPAIVTILDQVAPREVTLAVQTAQQTAIAASQRTRPPGASAAPANANAANGASGQSSASALPDIQAFNLVQQSQQSFSQAIVNASQTGSSSGSGGPPSLLPTIDTLFSQLFTLNTGTGVYADSNVPMLLDGNGVQVGHYNFALNVNFGARTVSASWQIIMTSFFPASNNTLSITNQSYAASNPAQRFTLTALGNCSGFFCQGDVNLTNAGGTIAKTANHFALLEGGSDFASGSRSVNRP